MIEFLIQSTILCVSGFVTDIIWALYIRKVNEKKKLQAALYSVGTGICTVVFVEGLLISFWLTFPWLVGLFCGTYFSDDVEQYLTTKLKRI
jgi:uncharacterized membrane protein